MKLFDTHTHLNDKVYQEDLDSYINDLKQAGLKKAICVGYDPQSNAKAIAIAQAYPNFIYAAIGFHPTSLNDISPQDYEQLIQDIKLDCVVAIGEIGLDYHWDTTTPNLQAIHFKKQIELAKKVNKPIIIHSRDALKDTYDILKEVNIKDIKGIMHSYSGSYEMALEFIKLNMMISLSGVITFKNAKKTKEVATKIDLAHLLIETDSPYLTPEPYRGSLNHSTYSYYVAKEIALLKNIDVQQVIDKTYDNATQIFKINED
ncbi:MAG: TatD family hydrolase [Bacilli bacterium]